MPRGLELSENAKGQIQALHTQGFSVREIAGQTGFPKSSVGRLIKRFRDTGSMTTVKKSGRPTALTARVRNRISVLVKSNPRITSSDISSDLSGAGVKVHQRTVRKWCQKRLSLPARRPAKKPLLTASARLRRLNWCKEYKNWTYRQWKKVLFSDESMIRQFSSNSFTNFVRRPTNSRFLPRYTVPTVKSTGGVMIWGCMSARGRGSIAFIPKGESINSKRFVDIIRERVPRTMAIHQSELFQLDNAPCHSSRYTKQWLQDNNIRVLSWPSNSPDISPIENLWKELKAKVARYSPQSEQQLIEAIKRVWTSDISRDYCKSLVKSLPRRIAMVINNHGFMTKY